ncbi:MAG TPA: DUF502 domain-containing protein [Negativicutes bacterium]|nr:DUF502 domain-containing protein [Negativicutes bacterium]
MGRISKYFLNGIIVLIPIAITAFVVSEVFEFTEWVVGRFLPSFLRFPGVALLVMLAVIVLIGLLSTHWALKWLLMWAEKMLNQIPGVKFVYNSVKQLSSAMLESKSLLKNPVLVPFPHPGARALGFITSDVSESIADHLPGAHVCVFVPMSLNLTAGFNIFVPADDIVPLDVTSESALQYVLTAGSIMPRSSSHFF